MSWEAELEGNQAPVDVLGNPKSLKDDANVEKYARSIRRLLDNRFRSLNELRRLVMRFGIHGSNVTRDMFSFLNLDYTPTKRDHLAGPELIDQRSRRMVEWEVYFGEIDVLIIDLIDERFL